MARGRVQRTGSNLINTTFNVISRSLSSAPFILLVGLALYSHHDPTLLTKFIAKLQSAPFLKPLGDFLKDKPNRTNGFIAFCGAALSLPSIYQLAGVAISGFYCFEIAKETTALRDFIGVAALALIFFKARSLQVRAVVAILAVILISYDVLTLPKA